jgi:hypothetical protein
MRILMLVYFFLISGCSFSKLNSVSESDLIGAWELLYDGNGDYWFSHVGFNSAGEKCTISYNFDNNTSISISYFLSSFNVEDGEMRVKVISSTSPYITEGEVIKDKLISYSPEKFEMQMFFPIFNDSIDRFIKLSNVRADDICTVVKKQFFAKGAS